MSSKKSIKNTFKIEVNKLKKRTTITDIANALKVTPATVSRALNGHSDISEKLKKRIFRTAEKMNYHRNKMASSLRSGKSYSIGVILPSAAHNFFGSVIDGIINIADQHGYEILIHQSNESYQHEVRGVKALMGARVDGILASIARNSKQFAHFVNAAESHVPVVFFDRYVEGVGIGSVSINDFKGAYQVTEYLINQGYKKTAYITGPLHIKAFMDRLKGYQKAMHDYGLQVKEEYIINGEVSIDSGQLATQKLLSLTNPPDAIFAVEDYTALGALKELKKQNLKIPEDIGLFGFCNELTGEHTTPTLSSVDQQTTKMGEEAFKLLHSYISSENPSTLIENKIVLEPKLIMRESSNRLQKPISIS